MNAYMKRALAQLVQDIKESDMGDAQKMAILNLAWSFYEFLDDIDEGDIDVSEDEADEILSLLPTGMEELE